MKQLFRNIFLASCLLLIAGTVEAQAQSAAKPTAQPINTDVPNSAAPVQTTAKGQPQGDTPEAKIAQAEFYKAQYPNDPLTQAKYQQAIDALKQELTKSSPKKD